MSAQNYEWYNAAMFRGVVAPLKPCPFCHGEPILNNSHNGSLYRARVKCSICCAEGAPQMEESAEEAERKATIAWNLRRE